MSIRKRIGTRFGMTIVVIGIFAAAVFGIAVMASIPDGDGVIHACYDLNKGNLRLVESSATCKTTEQTISWNQTGPRGPQGPAGNQGPPGSPGGLAGYEIVEGAPVSLTPGGTALAGAVCPSGKVAVGGGFAAQVESVFSYASFPTNAGLTWAVALKQTNTTTQGSTLAWPYAVCVSTS